MQPFWWVLLFCLVALAVSLWGARALLHLLILRGLRAPRVVHRLREDEPASNGRAVRVPVANGKSLFGWFAPVPGATDVPAVLVMHGWGANAAMMTACLAPLKSAGMAVLLLDARCHGLSDDARFTSLPRFAQDIRAGLDWLQQQPEVDSKRLAVIGHSVGAGAALLSAARGDAVQAVVSISAFAHPYEVMRRFLAAKHIPYPVVGWYILKHVQNVIGSRFDDIAPLHSIKKVRCPVLLVHGTEDETVPFADALRIQAAGCANTVRLMGVAGDHDPSEALLEELPQIVEFLQRAFEGR